MNRPLLGAGTSPAAGSRPGVTFRGADKYNVPGNRVPRCFYLFAEGDMDACEQLICARR
jgi:hypothetical protein